MSSTGAAFRPFLSCERRPSSWLAIHQHSCVKQLEPHPPRDSCRGELGNPVVPAGLPYPDAT